MTSGDASHPDEPKAAQRAPEAVSEGNDGTADAPAAVAGGPEAAAPPGDVPAIPLADMSDTELRELAAAVLAELRLRTNNPSSPGFSYQNLVLDLRRRLADAHALAQSGFGHRDKRITRPEAHPRDPPAEPPRALPAPASLSDEKKAMLVTGLEAELLSDLAPAHPEATGYLPPGWDRADDPLPDGATSGPVADQHPVASIEDEIWEALQREVGRSAGVSPPAGNDTPGR